jgi:hypothetical protein
VVARVRRTGRIEDQRVFKGFIKLMVSRARGLVYQWECGSFPILVAIGAGVEKVAPRIGQPIIAR